MFMFTRVAYLFHENLVVDFLCKTALSYRYGEIFLMAETTF